MRYGTVCSGIEAPTAAWEPLGWQAQWFSEIEPFPKAALAHHYPNVPDLGDMTEVHWHEQAEIDVLIGGTPCQSFSVAGLRKGLADPRGNLALEFLKIADIKRPRWIIWENVPGVLSSNGGRDFGAFLGALVQLGYGFSYRVLDALHFSCACPRPRVFVIGHFGGWASAAAVLFDGENCGNSVARVEGRPRPHTLSTQNTGSRNARGNAIMDGGRLRAMTVVETERALGFPDNYTRIPWRGKPAEDCPDGHRYKALGNSMAVPVVRWIGERIEMVEKCTT